MEQVGKQEKSVVLVVEDELLVRSTGADLLEDAGFEVVQACDADDALRILGARDDISVVFTDVEMPGSLDGLALAWRIRECWPGIGLVLTSGGGQCGRAMMPREGVFVEKPYMGSTLVRGITDVVRHLMAASRDRRALSL